jgi:hypothetical protein
MFAICQIYIHAKHVNIRYNYTTQFTQYSSFTRDENWKVMRCILEKFIPPPKPDGELGGLMIPALVADLPPLPSPRSKRAAEAAAALLNPGEAALLNMEPQDRFGMRSRSIND